MKTQRQNSEGALQLLLGVMTVIITLTGFGVWGIFRHWRFLVETQLRLDRCIGQVAKDFTRKINRLESLNRQIFSLRVAMTVDPRQIASLRLVVEGLAQAQNLTKTEWEAKQLKWMVMRGCGEWKDWPSPLPSLADFKRPLVESDVLGKKPLAWGEMGAENRPKEFWFQIHRPSFRGSRAAAARVMPEKTKTTLFSGWQAEWAVPVPNYEKTQ